MNNPKTAELAKWLDKEGDKAACYEEYEVAEKYHAAADRLETLEAELAAHRAQQRWIPVAERLPEDDDDVLIMSSGSISMGYYSTYNEYWADYINVYYNDVTHWMPLPEAPKE